MDIFNTVLLLFTLMLLAAIVYIPYMFIHKVVRAMVRTGKKTFSVFID